MHGKSKMPFNIGLWQGVDGSRIMAALNGKNYVHEWDGGDISKDNDLKNTAKSSTNHTIYRYYGTGDRGGSANINSAISIEKESKEKEKLKSSALLPTNYTRTIYLSTSIPNSPYMTENC